MVLTQVHWSFLACREEAGQREDQWPVVQVSEILPSGKLR